MPKLFVAALLAVGLTAGSATAIATSTRGARPTPHRAETASIYVPHLVKVLNNGNISNNCTVETFWFVPTGKVSCTLFIEPKTVHAMAIWLRENELIAWPAFSAGMFAICTWVTGGNAIYGGLCGGAAASLFQYFKSNLYKADHYFPPACLGIHWWTWLGTGPYFSSVFSTYGYCDTSWHYEWAR